MLDVGKLVRDDPFQFVLAQESDDAFGRGNGGMLRISSCGEGVRRFTGNKIDPGHRKLDLARHARNDTVQFGRFGLRDFACAIHHQDYLIGKPIAGKVHQEGKNKSNHHTLSAPYQ